MIRNGNCDSSSFRSIFTCGIPRALSMRSWVGCCRSWSRRATTRHCGDSPITQSFGETTPRAARKRRLPFIRAVHRDRDKRVGHAWEKRMRKRHLIIVLLAFVCSPALAAEPVGEWLVKDGGAQIRIEPCADALWGVISWTREPAIDSNNPDPAKRTRP